MPDAQAPGNADLLIEHGTVITLDGARRVIEDGAVVVAGGRIVAVGSSAEIAPCWRARKVINALRKAVLPGLIDCHAHAGHGLIKSMGGGDGAAWMAACETIYTTGSDAEFWYAEARLAALERLRCGTTTGVCLFGGGDNIMRVDDPVYATRHCDAISEIGTRSFLAVGPSRPPGPRTYASWSGEQRSLREVSFAQMFDCCEEIIRSQHGRAGGRVNICVTLPVYHPEHTPQQLPYADVFRSQARQYRDLARHHALRFTQDGHCSGSLRRAHEEFGLLGESAFMSHSIDLTAEDIAACVATGTRIVHNPSAIMSIRGRCPVPELLDAGVTVALGSDGIAPDRSYDMFRHMFQCMHYHRRHFRDAGVLPHGKVLEMVTIDAARTLGLEHEIGSIETGKKADIILVDLFKPHLMPLNMPVYRVTAFANGADVCTTIVDGKVLMEDGKVHTVDETEVMERAQHATERMLERTGLRHLLDAPPTLWRATRF
ncbi:amidohydrolase [Verminephrobacter aporrectodeae subsp. tuberculatae]|uniref:amidohydrolase family protein n=1 Tax=Verminephrobacter aporrectodeae TaxID=1110389 RepID=UPI0022387BFE|nr:amidohydrolase family protein [Verminephrobacter aporrectodeae]MCW5254955.1 amidohydrolase [Verminephrobacter aporrectodeae subsp. tuberculatae]